MNFEKHPWLADLTSPEGAAAIKKARDQFQHTGAVTFPKFITDQSLSKCIKEAQSLEDEAFTTDGTHTAYLLPVDPLVHENSVRNYEMPTQVASTAFDELPNGSELASIYRTEILIKLVKAIVKNKNDDDQLYLSEDPLGCCSINVFRPNYHHSFHFDESEFSTTLMLQEASVEKTGLFQYTHPLRQTPDDLALESVAATLTQYDDTVKRRFIENEVEAPHLYTLKFTPGTLSIFSGSKSLHRVTRVEGHCSRLVAVLTFASKPGFKNSPKVQKLFWGRSV